VKSTTVNDAGVGRQVPISRRSALRVGGLAALATGLLGTPGTTAIADAAPDRVVVVNTHDLAEECRLRKAELLEALRASVEAEELIREGLGSEAYLRVTSALSDLHFLQKRLMIAELARHLPGVGPVLLLLEEHIETVGYGKPGACCTVAEGYEL
jgi:hypothetical protein